MGEELEYIAHKGKHYQIEWYYTEDNKSQALEYYKNLSAGDRRKVLRFFQMMVEIGHIHNQQQFRNEGDKIYAFKPQPHRFLSFFFDGNKIIVTNAFIKKQQKLPSREKNKALKFKKDYESRIKKGSYYEK